MKKIVLILLLSMSVASAAGIWKNFNQFERDCQNKISHFYTCRFIRLNIINRLNLTERKMIVGTLLAGRDSTIYLDMIHNKKIKNYLSQTGKQHIKKFINTIESTGGWQIKEAKNNPEFMYNRLLHILNEAMIRKGIILN